MDNTHTHHRDDELDIDPRGTDYSDDYDMSKEINFYELKTHLAGLGFVAPQLVDALRERFLDAGQPFFMAGYKETLGEHRFRAWFEFRKDDTGDYQLDHYQALLSRNEEGVDKIFDRDITRLEALAVLRKDLQAEEPDLTLYWPMKRSDLETYFNQNLGTADAALVKLTATGLNLPPELLNQDGPIYYTGHHEIDGRRLVTEFQLTTIDEYKYLTKLTATLINAHIEKDYLNGIDPVLLDRLMGNTSWLEDRFDISQRRSAYVTRRYDQVERELQALSKAPGPRGREIAEQLRVRHWLGTPLDQRGMVAEEAKKRYTTRRSYDRLLPLSSIYEQLKSNSMNTQNLSYLQKQLLNLGFGESMNAELEKNIAAKTPQFTLSTTRAYNKQNVDYTLHFKAGDKDEMYFFNKYDAVMQGKDTQQTFYINKGSGITAKEAYNLMDGRAVHKQLENLGGEKYHAWLVLDKENKTENGNFKLRPFTEKWNYKPERAIDKMDIVGIHEEGARDKLMKSLEKGNRHEVTAMKEGKEVKVWLEANPAEHRVNLTNYKGEAQRLEHFKKPEVKPETRKEVKTAQAQGAAPEKKQTRRKGAKVSV